MPKKSNWTWYQNSQLHATFRTIWTPLHAFYSFFHTETQLGHQTRPRAKERQLDTENAKKSIDQSITADPCLGD